MEPAKYRGRRGPPSRAIAYRRPCALRLSSMPGAQAAWCLPPALVVASHLPAYHVPLNFVGLLTGLMLPRESTAWCLFRSAYTPSFFASPTGAAVSMASTMSRSPRPHEEMVFMKAAVVHPDRSPCRA